MKIIEEKICQKETQELKYKGVYSYIWIILPSYSTFKWLKDLGQSPIQFAQILKACG